MPWWVYEDDPTRRVRVHDATCRYCNNGHGVRDTRLPDNRWYGPFGTRDEAISKALSTERGDARGCPVCLPEVGSLR